ncbi:MAG: DNA polymerase III subunit delta [Rhizobiales bacterium]|nr:DNA polymerase III subunit delta [Hyphomicrobiales bacterium]
MTALKANQVDAFVARPDSAAAIVLVFGPDAGLVSERAEAIVRASVDDMADPFSVVRLAGDELASDPARLIDEAKAIPMFGGRRAIWVRAGGRNFMAALETLAAALPLTECRVVVEAGDLKKSAPLRSFGERSRAVTALPCYADSARDVERVIDEEMRAADLKIEPDARAVLSGLLGGDRRATRNEVRKLALYAHGSGTVSMDDVQAVVADASSLAIDGVLDAAFAGRPGEVDQQFDRLVAAGTAPQGIMSAGIRHTAQLHRMRLAVESGSNADDLLRQQRVHFRREALLKTALRQWNTVRLAAVLDELASTVLAMRRTGLKPEAALARNALLTIARAARRAAA